MQHLQGTAGAAFSTLGDNSDAVSEIGAFASALAKLWVHGREFPWNSIWSGGKRVPLIQYPFERKSYRFSENRLAEVKPIVANLRPVNPVVAVTQTLVNEDVTMQASELLCSQLGRLFSEFSGLQCEASNATFVENGFDSLVLMQIGVELGKKYGVSVSLRDLMEKQNTLKSLAEHISKMASPDRLPKAQSSQPTLVVLAHNPFCLHFLRSRRRRVYASVPADVAQLLRGQLAQMKEILECQLKLLDGVAHQGLPSLSSRRSPSPTD